MFTPLTLTLVISFTLQVLGVDGLTNFEQLLSQGAITELDMYVDTIGGGGASGLAQGIYYKPNQDLEFIDRLPDTWV